ncbi:MAG: hypothetical protein PSV35_02910 [bacterium]|nr:hypothetical protein [bacterium]
MLYILIRKENIKRAMKLNIILNADATGFEIKHLATMVLLNKKEVEDANPIIAPLYKATNKKDVILALTALKEVAQNSAKVTKFFFPNEVPNFYVIKSTDEHKSIQFFLSFSCLNFKISLAKKYADSTDTLTQIIELMEHPDECLNLSASSAASFNHFLN